MEGDELGRGPKRGTVLVSRHVHLPADPESAGRARRCLRELLKEAGRVRWMDDAELALSEVVTNALLHAHTAVDLNLEVGETGFLAEVTDHNPTLPVRRDHGFEATTGRGLELVAAITTAHGVEPIPDNGKTVWFVVTDDRTSTAREQSFDVADFDLNSFDDSGWPDAPNPQAPGTDVVLLSFPTKLWAAASEHHETIVRELSYYLTDHPRPDLDLPAADRARAVVNAAGAVGVDPGARAQRRDITVQVPADAPELFTALQRVLDAGEELALAGRLLARPGLPEIVSVRNWVMNEVIGQSAGAAPTQWRGAGDAFFETEVRAPDDEETGWDPMAVATSKRMVVAADEANRIVAVSEPLATFLGWSVDELVGRRLITIVPPSFREAHVAGFSRHLSTGETRILGTPIEVPVLTRSGDEVPCRLLIEKSSSDAVPATFVGWIDQLA